ncbi:LysR family transcriptional regulator [Humitalea rosea]|uniref:LysR family transcriptional regulator n=1 Tax=Humitalea rosea TaxID=990373 RepID=A0A2W7I027_9PROT|nr:LysR substrate-binding domain-containing protein [Humitalea rosea]PZW40074.1 LysR family transcriptional regulator [Humitalea rosea]
MADPLPPLGPLLFFAMVAETGSLTGAAARLNVTQPAVSRRLRELERALGVALVHRGANALRLTEAGARYAEAVAASFGTLRAATAALTANPDGPFRIRAYATWAMRWLIPRLPGFYRRHPDIEVQVSVSNAPDVDFLRDRVDAAIRTAPVPPIASVVQLQRVEVAPFAHPAAVRGQGRGAGRGQGREAAAPLAGLTLLGSSVRPRHWDIWRAAHPEVAGLAAAPLLFDGTSLAIQAALEGLGAVITPPSFVEEEVRRRRLRRLAPGAVATGDSYWLLLPPGPPSRRAAAFRDWLLEEAGGRRR